MLSSRIHKEKLAAKSFGTHLAQIAPGILRAAIHNIAKLLPLLLGLSTCVGTTCVGRRSRHVIARLISLSLLLIEGLIAVDVHGDNFGEVAISVVSQMVGISQDGLHRIVASSKNIQLLSLLYQEILKGTSVLIEDARSFDTEVTNDLGGYGAYARLRGRRSLRGSLGRRDAGRPGLRCLLFLVSPGLGL